MAECIELWGSKIEYDEIGLKLKVFSDYLMDEGKKSVETLIGLGKDKSMGWGIKCWEFLPKEMPRICDKVGKYVVDKGILTTAPNWSMFLPEYINLANDGTKIFRQFADVAYNIAAVQAREKYEQAYQQELRNSEGLGFGIISNSFSAHLLYAVQSVRKEQENEKNAHNVAQQVYNANSPFKIGDALINDFYDKSFEPYLIELLTRFFGDVQCLIFKGAERDVSSVQFEDTKTQLENKQTDEENKIVIVEALSKNILSSEAVIHAIQKGLVDDEFVLFFNKSPKLLQTNTVDAVKELLLKNKKDSNLFNKEVFNERTISIIKCLKKLFNKDSTYNNLIEAVYKSEIESVCDKFDTLIRIYRNDGALSAFAIKGQNIHISKADIERLVFINDVLEISKTSNILSALNCQGDSSHIEDIISNTNTKIKIEYENYRKAEEERKQRELEHQQEVIRKKNEIRAEISNIQNEIDGLGLAWFGKKAQRKAELNELISKKRNELDNIK